MGNSTQLDFCLDKDAPLAARAWNWMHTRGGRMIMRDLYALAASFVSDWQNSGIPISMSYLFEIERHRIKLVRARAQKMHADITRDYGYTLNNSYRAYVARHILNARPDWAGLFELREVQNEHV
jgi:hypothetical protein